MKYLFILASFCLLLSSYTYGEDTYSDSASGAIAGSQSGSIGYIDNGTHTSEAVDMQDRAPGVFAAGVTAGGSNPCVVSIGGGLSVPGGGLNFANAYNDGECNVRESLRLMAAISSSAEASNQILLREVSCQSVTLWDAMERTYMETKDERYMCSNERPKSLTEAIAYRRAENAASSPRVSTRSVSQIDNGFFD